jgi:hypothetical protein
MESGFIRMMGKMFPELFEIGPEDCLYGPYAGGTMGEFPDPDIPRLTRFPCRDEMCRRIALVDACRNEPDQVTV